MHSAVVALLISIAACSGATAKTYDLAINNGRALDPETGLDGVRHIGISGGVIVSISRRPLNAKTVIDATGLTVAPGFIDRNTYVLGAELFRLRASDGVTTAFNFEEGAHDVAAAYSALEGAAIINYGFSASEGAARIALAAHKPVTTENGFLRLNDTFTAEEISSLYRRGLEEDQMDDFLGFLERGLKEGAPAIGLSPEYFPQATEEEALEVFRLAAKYDRAVQIHPREWTETRPHGRINEVIAGAVSTGAAIHISHMNSVTTLYTDYYLELVAKAQAVGLQVTTECYPYAESLSPVDAPFYDDWRDWPDEAFEAFERPGVPGRATRESFEQYRREGGPIIEHGDEADNRSLDACLTHPIAMIASDSGGGELRAHPRAAGSNTRVLARYVREKGLLSLSEAVRKMTLLPAQSLERAAPQMAKKGRIQKGMDADIVIFDAAAVVDRATYAEPGLEPEGIAVVIVNGVIVKRDGRFTDHAAPGRPIRLPSSN